MQIIRFYRYCLFILFIVLLLSPSLFGGVTGKIAGVITEEITGESLPGVTILVEGTNLGAATDKSGYYSILNVPVGVYTLKISIMGYATVKVTDVAVRADLTTTVDAKLKPTAVELEQVITVIAERPIIQKDVTATSRIVDAEEIKTMPVNSYAQVVALSAGVTTDFRGTHIRGGRVSETIYQVDGLPIQDVQVGYPGATVTNAAIAEVSILSGGFNAEYGNAQSGVVNIVTKEGGEKFEGSFESQLEIPGGPKKYETGYQRYIGNFGGTAPFYKKLRFFLSGEVVQADDGYPGIRRVDQPVEIRAYNTKINYNISPNIKLNFGALYNLNKFTRYVIDYKLRPWTFPHQKTITQQYTLSFTHFLTKNTFYDLSLGYYRRHLNEHQLDKWWDIRYNEDWNTIDATEPSDTWGSSYAINNISIRPEYLETNSDYTTFYDYLSISYTGKGSLTKSLGKNHTVKTGFEITIHDLNYFLVHGVYGAPYIFGYGNRQPIIENGKIKREKVPAWLGLHPVRPKQYGIYLQDKMEYGGIIMNVGVRVDAFDPAASKPKDIWRAFYPGNDTIHYPPDTGGAAGPWTYGGPNFDIPVLRNLKKSSIKYHISPRLGVSHPVTERDVLHFSYGQFFQMPPFYYLYYNQNYSYDWWFIVGNPDLDAEKTISYEVGIAHAFTKDLAINVTAFYKDIDNLSNIRNFANPADPKKPYDDPENPEDDLVDAPVGIQTYVNEDWGNVKGLEFSIRKRPSNTDRLSGTITYTYMIAKGKSSDPREGMLLRSNQTLPPTKYYSLDWDLHHKIVANIDYRVPWNYGINLLIDYASGLPYTGPQTSIQWEYNDRRLPYTLAVDMKVNKTFRLSNKHYVNLYVQVTNLFNKKNVTRFNEESTYVPIIQYIEEHPGEWGGPLNNPLVYGSHRQLRGGLEIHF